MTLREAIAKFKERSKNNPRLQEFVKQLREARREAKAAAEAES